VHRHRVNTRFGDWKDDSALAGRHSTVSLVALWRWRLPGEVLTVLSQSRTLMRCTPFEHRNAETQPYDDLRLRTGRASSGHRLRGDSFSIVVVAIRPLVLSNTYIRLHVYIDGLRKLPSRLHYSNPDSPT